MFKKIAFVCLAYLCSFNFLVAQSTETPVITPLKALEYLRNHAANYGLDETDLANARLSDLYTEKKTGITHAYIQQYYNGVPVINAMMGMHFNRQGKEIHAANTMLHFKSARIPGDVLIFDLANLGSLALKQGGLTTPGIFEKIDPAAKNVFSDDKRFYYECAFLKDSILESCVNFIFYNATTSDFWNIFVSKDGRVIEKINWTVHCSFDKKQAHTSHSGPVQITKTGTVQAGKRSNSLEKASYAAFGFPIESPIYGKVDTLISIYDTSASPKGWHDIDGVAGEEFTITRGNNVYASVDETGGNVAGFSPDGGTALDFRFPYDRDEPSPLNYQSFAVTNLFVANNLMHDISYHYGFDEVSGNFQDNNYGKGGLGLDYVNADAQDGSGTNNANFSTMPDGNKSRMQMYIWDAGGSGITLKVNSPVSASYIVSSAAFGPDITASPISGKLVFVVDAVGAAGQACGTISNKSAIKNNIAAIRRGSCLFAEKVYNAQLAGAIAVVVFDTSTVNALVSMSGTDSRIIIPSVFLRFNDANDLTEIMNGGLTDITLYDSSVFNPKTDSDLDMGVIAHEYTHGISNRLTCGPNNTSALNNAEQMGEGWSDFVGLAFTAKTGDIGSKTRGIGNWLIGQGTTGGGIRIFPYTTNMALNPHVYNDIKAQSQGGRTQVHYLGEVWCCMLWDLHWMMVEKYGFSTDLYYGNKGNNMCLQLVFDGMKLQKCNPGFVDGRDAILKADSIRNGAANSKLIWEVFARRGLGFSASQGSSYSTSDGIQAFDIPAVFNATKNPVMQFARLYPNPASELLTIEATNSRTISKVEILSVDGKLLQTVQGNTDFISIGMHALTPGIYLARVYGDNGQCMLKFIRE